jgi:tetratricopeptide (TPR) repeat protein
MSERTIIGYRFGDGFEADTDNRLVYFQGVLRPKVKGKLFDVLQFFLERPGKAIERSAIQPLSEIFYPRQRQPIDDYISRLRDALGTEHKVFETVRGTGYRLECRVTPIFKADRDEANILYRISSLHFNDHTTLSMRAALVQALKGLESPDPDTRIRSNIIAAWCYLNLSTVAYCQELPSKVLPQAKAHAEKALSEDPHCAEALGILGLIALIFEFDWLSAEESFEKALKIDPDEQATLHAYAHWLISRGDFQKGLECAQRAVIADPTDKIVEVSLGWFYMFAGQRKKAEETTESSVFRFPEHPPAHFIRGLVLEQRGDYDEARESYQRALTLDCLPIFIAALGHLEGTLGNKSVARAALSQLRELHKQGHIKYKPAYCDALIYAGLGDKERALKALEEAYDQKCDWLIHLAVEPRWNEIRNDIRFQKLMEKVNVNFKGSKRP